LDSLLLEKAFMKLLDHHDALRIIFTEDVRGRVKQINTESAPGFKLSVIDLTDLTDWPQDF
jgi:hypothetical protein